MTFTVKEICENIWALEEEYGLNHKVIQGCYPWQLTRLYIYYEITRKLNVFESAQQSSLSFFDKVNSFLPFIKNSLIHNPLSGKEECNVLIFDHPRKAMHNGEYQDIYSYFLKDSLNKENKTFETIESPYLNNHFRTKENIKSNNVKFNDRILLGSFIYKTKNRGKLPFTDEEKEFINTVKEELENSFDIEIDLFRIIEDHILNFKYEYNKYIELLERKKPKQVFLVVAYENKALIAACKKKNIEIIELQHGTISLYHLGYSYPKNTMKINDTFKEIEYFPDKILSFGDYWQNACPFPIEKSNIISMGFPYFEDNSKMFMDMMSNEKNPSQILFISQGVIGKYLSKLAYETLRELNENKLNNPNENNQDNQNNENNSNNPIENNQDNQSNENNLNDSNNHDYTIIYKLHPGEYETWRENYPYLNKAVKEFDNFKVIDNSQTPLYEFFAKSSYQVGAFSTAIYEGLAFNCKTFIIDVPGVEYLDDLIDKNIVKKVNDSNELINYLNKDSIDFMEYDKNYFFKNYDEDVIKEIVNK